MVFEAADSTVFHFVHLLSLQPPCKINRASTIHKVCHQTSMENVSCVASLVRDIVGFYLKYIETYLKTKIID